ncbi:hypothetical protein MMC31_004200, partial [Peltigera leucophlebia]|nr:hypothetical protein [Peltigera leucophlebia]
MVSPKVPDFLGPIAPLELTTWLKGCESVYNMEKDKRKDRDPDRSKNTKSQSDVPKIKAAGSALLAPNLAEWWKAEQSDFLKEGATWDDFVEALKGKALGHLWRAHALKTFYTLQQNDASLDDYLAAMADARYVLNHGGVVIDDEQFKSLLLFRASPSLSEKVFAEQGFDLNKARPKDIRTKLRYVADGSNPLPMSREETADPRSQKATQSVSIVPTPENGESLGFVLLTSLTYGVIDPPPARDFFDLDRKYLVNTRSLGPVRGVALFVNPNKVIYGYRITFDENANPLQHPAARYNNLPFAYCSLDYDDYINSLTLTWKEDKTSHPNSIKLGTSKGKSCVSGVETEIQVTLKPPTGWRIVGLHGSGHFKEDEYQVLTAVGAIYAPIQIG